MDFFLSLSVVGRFVRCYDKQKIGSVLPPSNKSGLRKW